jgi:predicted dithiol-disulfide oxidoreductase (DUF899 family)
MTVPLIVAASEWLAARKELLAAEAQAASALEAVTACRRERPAVPVGKDYDYGAMIGLSCGTDPYLALTPFGRQDAAVAHHD